MGTSSGYRISRILFVILNVLFLIMGIAMIVVGGYMQISESNYISLMSGDAFFKATALLICAGVIVVVVSIFGFAGVWMESQCVILVYFLCVLIILALSIAAGIIAYVFYNEIDNKLQEKMLEGLQETKRRDEWDTVQSKERCCGVTSYEDWYNLVDNLYPEAIPDSCCDGPNCGLQGGKVAYDIGCYTQGKEWVQDNFYAIGAFGIAIGIGQIILLVASLGLLICMRRETKL